MSQLNKINFINSRISRLSDYTQLVEMLFPGNRNQQYAAACILFELKWKHSIVHNMAYMEDAYRISRRILERTRAKLSKLGVIEHISYLNSRYHGQSGWKLSMRFSSTLRRLALYFENWCNDKDTRNCEKEKLLMELL
jgi:hypothetical protein